VRAGWIEASVFSGLEAAGTTAFRLYGAGDISVERFGSLALISAPTGGEIDRLVAETRAFAELEGWECFGIFWRRLVRVPGEADKPERVWGERGGGSLEVVSESGLKYEVDLAASYSPGLFCDQRGNREFLRGRRPRRVLNLFSYTCAFSVASAAAGALTTSVDVSKGALERGRRNFQLNGIALDGHRFVVEDAADYLRRLVRRGEVFDSVIVDPPTFGRAGGKKTFQIVRDLPNLVALAAEATDKSGAILFSTNYRGWSRDDFEEVVQSRLPLGAKVHRVAQQPDFSPGSGSMTMWALL